MPLEKPRIPRAALVDPIGAGWNGELSRDTWTLRTYGGVHYMAPVSGGAWELVYVVRAADVEIVE